MNIDASNAELREVPVKLIDRNPENPRILFRAGELEQLLESIRIYGVQVPISVYRDGRRYVLIDGERRWRCCLKLNKETIPALVQDKPQPLTNLLLMFNIHALREQWDLLTIALKLPRVIKLLTQQLGTRPNERHISAQTGLSLGVIRRCKLLIELPDEYKDTILEELQKPKPKQRLTEDFFIEMERALKTVDRAMPAVIRDRDAARKALIAKYRSNTITNIVQFRQIAKIARADNVAADPRVAQRVLKRLFEPNEYSIEQAYSDSVSEAYSERDLLSRLDALVERLDTLRPSDVDDALREKLRILVEHAQRLLRSRR
jgi:ParB/RepB/Spo0J family partition protein